ncbi:PREDICTED: uncharacterized protein LOC104800129 isoform X2 [Tarenaya hassleriana]|uniref:uncharacterized protein LOC104800129 isoform X2 n=1 Tax=Tarenaya hassleriana TaxID=28532 RepID=UPI00053C4054|nr:PREDICTED: uncharacterized protein LOC104800129 isoform X2 [Tarenaya hassleriana]
MTNIVALCLILTTFLAAEVWTPSPAMTHSNEPEADIIVKDGHRLVVVEYEKEGKTNTKIVISPPETKPGEAEEGDNRGVLRNVKDRVKETTTYLPNVGQGISRPETNGEDGEARGRHATPGELICDAFGKCRHKIASTLGKAKDRISRVQEEPSELGETARETVDESGESTAAKADEAKETVARMTRGVKESMGHKAQDTMDKISETAHDSAHKLKETMAHIAQEAKDKAAHIAQEAKDKAADTAQEVKDKAAQKAQESKDKAAHKAQEMKDKAKMKLSEKAEDAKNSAVPKAQTAWGKVKTAAKEVKTAAKEVMSPAKVGGVVGLTALAMAYGTCIWVTFVSSYVLAGVLGRNQFGLVQSKVYPVYFKTVSLGILVGLVGHVIGRSRKLLTDSADMWQAMNLLTSFLMVEGNGSILDPRATRAMFERMKVEKEEGRGADEEETRQKLRKLSERLQKLNTYSSWINILTLMSLTWHLVYIGQRLTAASS